MTALGERCTTVAGLVCRSSGTILWTATFDNKNLERALGTEFSVGVGGDACLGIRWQLGQGSDPSESQDSPYSYGGCSDLSQDSSQTPMCSTGITDEEDSSVGSSSEQLFERMSRRLGEETRTEWSCSSSSSSEMSSSTSSSRQCDPLERLERALEREEIERTLREVAKEPQCDRTVCVWNTGFANVVPFRRALRSACISREDGAPVGFNWDTDTDMEGSVKRWGVHQLGERRLVRVVKRITMINQLANGQIRFDVVCRSVPLARWLVETIDTIPRMSRWFSRLHIANPMERPRSTASCEAKGTGMDRDRSYPEGSETLLLSCSQALSSLDGSGEKRPRQGNNLNYLASESRVNVTLQQSPPEHMERQEGDRILARSPNYKKDIGEELNNERLVERAPVRGTAEDIGSLESGVGTDTTRGDEGSELRLCLLLMTLNICGLVSKSDRLAARLQFLRQRPTVIALQETGRKQVGGSVGLSGYRLIEYPVTWVSRNDLSVADPPEEDPCFAGTPEERSQSEFFRSRGLALAVSCGEVVTETWRKPYLVAARVANASGTSYVVMSVYVNPGHGRSVASRILRRIGDFVAKIVQKYPDEAVIAMGDWNRSRSDLRKFMRSRWDFPLDFTKQAAFMESSDRHGAIRVQEPILQPTFEKGRHQSVLDHILFSPGRVSGSRWKAVTRVRRWDLSDHFPVFSRLEEVKRRENRTSSNKEGAVDTEVGNEDGWQRVVANGRKRNLLLRKAFRKAKVVESISTSNYWSTLANMLEVEGSGSVSGEAALQHFTQVVDTTIAEAMPSASRDMFACPSGVNSTAARRQKGFDRLRDRVRVGKNGRKNERFPGRITRLLRKRQKAFKEWRMAVNNDLGDMESEALIERRHARLVRHDKFVKHAIHAHRGEQWVRFVQGWVDGAFPDRASSTVRGQDEAEDTSDVITDPGAGPREHWRGIRSVMASKMDSTSGSGLGGQRRRGVGGTSSAPLIRHPTTGELIVSSEEASQVFMDHWAKLAEDATGHSQDRAYWKQKKFASMLHEHEALPEEEINAPISAKELWTVTKKMKRGKAPGFDGITNELFMTLSLFSDDEASSEGSDPLEGRAEGSGLAESGDFESRLTDFGRVVLRICQRLFDEGVIPEEFNVATVVPVPKKGDLTDIDNYRGISLINTLVKLVTKIVTDRLSSVLEKAGRLCSEQAGFRRYEETHTQITGLYEVLRRRQVQGLPSYVTFIDFAKAYDTVPHEALFLKMEKIGVHGRMMAFFRGLYASSSLTVPGGTTRRVPLRRGVRQGCPSSPILFDIFINDFFLEWKGRDLGVAGWERPPQRTAGGRRRGRAMQAEGDAEGRRICGFLFADDACALTETCRDTQVGLKLIGRWADRWEMRIGHHKCGLMRILPVAAAARRRQEQYSASTSQLLSEDAEAVEEERRSELRRWIRASAWAQVQQGRIPIVDEYLYLGCMFNDRLDLAAMAQHRAAFSKLRFEQTRDFLGMTSLPMSIRAKVFKVIVLQTGLYGAELWGMSSVRCQALQRIANRAIRKIGGHNAAGVTSVASWAHELRIEPVAILAAERRLRAYTKFRYGGPNNQGVSTQIKLLLNCQPPSLRHGRTWTSGVAPWVKRFGGEAAWALLESGRTLSKADLRVLRKEWWQAVDERVTRNGRHVRHADYLLSSMNETAPVIRQVVSRHVELAKGATLMMQCRTGTLWTGSRLAAIGYLPSDFKKRCPCCGKGVYVYDSEGEIVETGETEAHLLLECEAWIDLRGRWVSELALAADRLLETSTGRITSNKAANGGGGCPKTHHHCHMDDDSENESAEGTESMMSNPSTERGENDPIFEEGRLKQIRLLLLGGQLRGSDGSSERLQLESWRRSVRAIARRGAEEKSEALAAGARVLANEEVARIGSAAVASEEGSDCSGSDETNHVQSVPSDVEDVACLSVLRYCQAVRALRHGRIHPLIEAHLEGRRRRRRAGQCEIGDNDDGSSCAGSDCSELSLQPSQGEKSDSSMENHLVHRTSVRPRRRRFTASSSEAGSSEEMVFTLCCDRCGSPTPNFCPCKRSGREAAAVVDGASSSLDDDVPLLQGGWHS